MLNQNELVLPSDHSQNALTDWLKANSECTFRQSQKQSLESYLTACMPDARTEEIDLYMSKLSEWFKISFN